MRPQARPGQGGGRAEEANEPRRRRRGPRQRCRWAPAVHRGGGHRCRGRMCEWTVPPEGVARHEGWPESKLSTFEASPPGAPPPLSATCFPPQSAIREIHGIIRPGGHGWPGGAARGPAQDRGRLRDRLHPPIPPTSFVPDCYNVCHSQAGRHSLLEGTVRARKKRRRGRRGGPHGPWSGRALGASRPLDPPRTQLDALSKEEVWIPPAAEVRVERDLVGVVQVPLGGYLPPAPQSASRLRAGRRSAPIEFTRFATRTILSLMAR